MSKSENISSLEFIFLIDILEKKNKSSPSKVKHGLISSLIEFISKLSIQTFSSLAFDLELNHTNGCNN